MALAEALRDDGHDVFAYPTPGALPGLETISRVSVVITDYDMPGMNGLTLADRLHAYFPGMPVVLVTAYASRVVEATIASRGFVHLRYKPLDYEDVHGLLHRVVAA